MRTTLAGLQQLLLGLVLLLPAFGWTAYAQANEGRATESQAQRQQVQPGNNAPTWREVRSGKEEYTAVKGRETGVLIQTQGETWRKLRNGPITFYGGWLLVLGLISMGVFYKLRGPIPLHSAPSGKMIERFSSFERIAHWTVAISFCILAASGLIMLFGKHVLLPVIGHTLFAWLAEVAKDLHNFVGLVFCASVVLMIVVFVRDTLPARGDLAWILRAGGAFEGKHMPTGKHHAGHKIWFWGAVVVMSTIIGVSGLVMDFPVFGQTRAVMIVVNVVHAVAAGLLMALSLTHIYMGTIGVPGAYEGMRYGYVDETYAKEHHLYWYEDVKSGKVKVETAEGKPEAPQMLQGVGETT